MVSGGVTIVAGDAWPERFSLVVQLLLKVVVVHISFGPTITQEHQTNVYTGVTSIWYA